MNLLSSLNQAWDTKLFTSTFALIFIAELPDKTVIATLLMATNRSPIPLFIGVALAFVIQSLVAVCFGGVFGLLPPALIKYVAAGLFFVFAWMMLKSEDEEEEVSIDGKSSRQFFQTLWSSFVVIFIAEWGDLTQLATATLTAQYRNPITIFISATLALWTATALAILIGNRAKHLINPHLLKKVGAVAFIGVGIYMLIEAIKLT